MAANAAPRANAIFKVKAGGRTRLIVFDTQDLTLGRAPENDLCFDDPEMSRRHAVFKRSREGCQLQDMGTSNGTEINGQPVSSAMLGHGDVVRVGEVEITYAETARNPSSLGSPVEYASQLKAFGTPMARVGGDGEATILGLGVAMSGPEGDDFEVRPAGDFDFDLAEAGAAERTARDLDAEIADLGPDPLEDFSFGAAPSAPVKASAPAKAWELDDAPPASVGAEGGRVSLTLEIEGLEGDLRHWLEGLADKVLELPKLRVRIKSRDLD